MLYNSNTGKIFIFIGCPSGYIEKIGDVEGGGLTGGYSAKLAKCASDCDRRDDCKSFEYSPSQKDCKLLNEWEPTGPKYMDLMFCAKEGNIFILIVCVQKPHIKAMT